MGSEQIIALQNDATSADISQQTTQSDANTTLSIEDLYQNENYVKKLQVYAEKLGMTIDEIKSKRLSKNQLKKMARNEVWKTERLERRKVQREKRKLKRQELIQQNRYNPIRFVHMKDSANKIKIVIDLSFDSQMKDKELQKTFKQVQRCYAINRRCPEPCQLYLTSVSGNIRAYIDSKDQSIDKWDVNVIEEHWYDHFKGTGELDKICYLTADSCTFIPEADVIKQTRDDRIYIIGGLVDHNIYKNLTLNIAKEKQVATGKLPIDKYVRMSMTKVLAINHVFELMLRASTGTSWEESFNRILPARKVYTDSTSGDESESLHSNDKSQTDDHNQN